MEGMTVQVGSLPVSSSVAPRPTVSAEVPVAAAITLIPPRPNRRAPAPSSSRRARSSRTGDTSASTAANISANPVVSDVAQL